MRVISAKQREVLSCIVRANPDGTWLDLDQILERLTYAPTKAALQFTVRQLVERGLAEKKPEEFRRGFDRRVLAPTLKGYEVLR